MDQTGFWILLIILIICLAAIYKLYRSNKHLLELCRDFVSKISEKQDYLFLTADQVLCLPEDLKKQTEKLMSEIRETPCTIDEHVLELPNSRMLLLLHQPDGSRKKIVIGILKIFLLSESPATRDRVLEKINPSLMDNPIYISSVIVDARYRGQGYGAQLLNILFRMIKKDSILEVKKINTPAVKLYRNSGFKIIGQDSETYLMRRFLDKIP
jgi:GNAT superfamily N-acetyltransferase